MYKDEYGQAYIYDGYAQGYVKAYENPYTGEYYTKAGPSPYEDPNNLYDEEDYYEESPEEIWEQYMQHLRDTTQKNYKDMNYIKTLSTQYLGYIIL